MNNSNTDRLPPHSPDAEQGVLGCCLLSPPQCIAECIQKFAGLEVFYDLRHQTIYQILVEMFNDQDGIDIITVVERLKVYNLLNNVGGIPYIAALPDVVPSSSNIDYYIDIVQEKFILRKMIQTCTEIVSKIYDFEGNINEIMDQCERDVLKISQLRVQKNLPTTRELVVQAINDIEAANQRGGLITGLPSGLIDLDRLTNGFKPQEMIVIAARPSMGKTSLAMNIAEYVSVNEKVPVGVFSLEMSSVALITRMLCSRSRVNLRNVRDGFLSERDFPKLTNAAGAISSAPIYLDDSAGLSILQLRAKARRMMQQYGIRLFVIDYLQLLNAFGGSRRHSNRQEEVSEISAGIKNLAKESNVPVIVLSQLNRELERDKDRKPRLSDLRESGAIENDADFIGLLYKPQRGEDEPPDEYLDAIPINLLIAKQRNGQAGVDVNLTFLKMFTRFESAARVSNDDNYTAPQQNLTI